MAISESDALLRDEDIVLQIEITKLLNREARLLDEGRFEEWLEWMAPSIRYFWPIRAVRKASERDLEYGEQGEDVGFYDDDLDHLKLRVRKSQHSLSWSDNPAARIVRAVSNIEPTMLEDGRCKVRSVVNAFRSRFANANDHWVVVREDILERGERGWLLAQRTMYSPPTVLPSPNLDVFF